MPVWTSGSIVPQRYPCGAVGGTERSRQCGGGSFVAGRETRICRSGIGRSCCRHGRRAYPAVTEMSVFSHTWVSFSSSRRASSQSTSKRSPPLRSPRTSRIQSRGTTENIAYLARVDSLTREGIVVRSHFEFVVALPVVVGWLSKGDFKSGRPTRFSLKFLCAFCARALCKPPRFLVGPRDLEAVYLIGSAESSSLDSPYLPLI